MRFAFCLTVLICFSFGGASQTTKLPDGFVSVADHIPNISIDLRYYSTRNFIGDTIDGYRNKRLIMSEAAVVQLKKVQNELNENGLGLRVYDAYRPQMAVNLFVQWARVLEDTLKKTEFYPNVKKQHLFKEGYIASQSGHSRGSTIDLTIINLKTDIALDMGSPFDFFGKPSWVDYKDITPVQKENRQLLQEIMNKYGFRSYSKEWWHFTLINEPFPQTYFNFPIE